MHSPVGTLVYTGDFKFDQSPMDGKVTDFARLAELGAEGVLALMSDCVRVEQPGFTPSERLVIETFDRVFDRAEGRVLITTFASNISRVQQAIQSAHRHGRKSAVVGRSMESNVAIARELDYLKIPDGALLRVDEVNKLPPEKILYVTTGSQGEPTSVLSRIANKEHRQIQLGPGDTVVISATPVPGNEEAVARTINNLFRQGVDVIYGASSTVHVSGHASREELRLMINLLRPQFVVPGPRRVPPHGPLQAGWRRSAAYRLANVLLPDLGSVMEFGDDNFGKITGKVEAGDVLVDGVTVGEVGEVVLRDRRLLSKDGVLIVVVTVDRQTGQVVAGPDLVSRGFVYASNSEELLEAAKDRALQAVTADSAVTAEPGFIQGQDQGVGRQVPLRADPPAADDPSRSAGNVAAAPSGAPFPFLVSAHHSFIVPRYVSERARVPSYLGARASKTSTGRRSALASGSRSSRGKKRGAMSLPPLDPRVRGKVAAVTLIALAAAGALSLVFASSEPTQRVKAGLLWFAGWGAMSVPVALLWAGVMMLTSRVQPGLRGQRLSLLGASLLALSFISLMQLSPVGEVDLPRRLALGQGGGFVGLLLADLILRNNIGIGGTVLVLLSCLTAGSMLVWRVTPGMVLAFARQRWTAFQLWREERAKIVVINAGHESVPARREPAPSRAPSPSRKPDAPAPESTEEPAPAAAGAREWLLPPINIFESIPEVELSQVDIRQRIKVIEDTLKSFGVEARVVEVNQGPAVTQFGVEPGVGVKVARIMALGNDLALRLAAAPLRLEAPVPGKQVVGIEVPNGTVAVVSIRDLLESPQYVKHKGKLRMALGRDVSGNPVVSDLAKMPHLLIAGATGSGKSVCLNSFIAALLFQNSPEDLRMIMIDPKMVEMMPFNGIPHLLTPVVTEMDKVVPALKWVVMEMERRYRLFAGRGCRNVEAFNRAASGKGTDLPSALHRSGHRRAGRPDDGGPRRGRADTVPAGTARPCHRHPPGGGHPTPLGRRGDRPDQGQLPHPDLLRRHFPGGLTNHPGPGWGGEVAGTRRHALPPQRRIQAHAIAGDLRIR